MVGDTGTLCFSQWKNRVRPTAFVMRVGFSKNTTGTTDKASETHSFINELHEIICVQKAERCQKSIFKAVCVKNPIKMSLFNDEADRLLLATTLNIKYRRGHRLVNLQPLCFWISSEKFHTARYQKKKKKLPAL